MPSMESFFLNSFERDFYANQSIFESLIEQEEVLPDKALKLASHIINVHHIWLSELNAKKAESVAWDVLPIDYICVLNSQNYKETVHFIEFSDCSKFSNQDAAESTKLFKESLHVLQHILGHSAYHRGQIVLLLKDNKLSYPNMDWITIR